MKTTFFKTGSSFALVAMLGISGAFMTTSMQSSIGTVAPKTGYIDTEQVPCSVPVGCSDFNNGLICQAEGQQAFGKEANCNELLYRPQP